MADVTSETGSQGGGLKLNKKELLQRYRDRTRMSRKWRTQEGIDGTWDRLRDLYAGKQFTNVSSEDRIAVNIAFATINVIAPSIAVNHPKITVWARSPEDEDRATITEAVVNYWWKHHNFKPHFRRSVKDYLIYGCGWLKVGYRYQETTAPLTDEEFEERFFAKRAEMDEYAVANPDLAGDLPTDDEIAATMETDKTVVVEDAPFVERVSPYDIFVDPEATCLEDATWVAQRITRTLEEVKKDTRYSAAVRRNLVADGEVTQAWRDEKRKYGDDVLRITLWEFYDLERKTLSVFTEGGDKFLIDPIGMPYTFGLPFVMVRNYDIPEKFYPIGDLEALIPLQDELNEVRSAMVQARKQDLPKTMYRRSMSPDAVSALKSSVRNEMVPIDDDTPFEQLVSPVPHSMPSPQLYQHSEVIESDIDHISGVNEYMRGGIPETRRTATEATIIADAANARAADKLDTIEAAIRAVAERIVQLAQQYMTGESIARVVGANGMQTVWVPFTRRDIQGQFDFQIEAGSTQPMNESFRRQQATQLLNAMAPFLESGIVNVPELLQYTLQYGFGLPNPGRFVQAAQPALPPGQPPPEQPQGTGPNDMGGAATQRLLGA